jgi:hypothetical protein
MWPYGSRPPVGDEGADGVSTHVSYLMYVHAINPIHFLPQHQLRFRANHYFTSLIHSSNSSIHSHFTVPLPSSRVHPKHRSLVLLQRSAARFDVCTHSI